MANPEHVKIVRRGKEAIARWIKDHPEMSLYLRDADLRGADLRGANLFHADLRGADLRGADLLGAGLCAADVSGADLRGARFRPADVTYADLCAVDLSGADLREAPLYEANFRQANFSRANLEGTRFFGGSVDRAKFDGSILRSAEFAPHDRIRILERRIKSRGGNDDQRLSESDERELRQLREIGCARNLYASQLAGADLENAKLPEDISFDLRPADEARKHCRTLSLALSTVCLYVFLIIGTTTDEALVSGTMYILPIIGAEIPLTSFYWLAPLILVAALWCFQIYLQGLWDRCAKLPAVLVSGEHVVDVCSPWLLRGCVRKHCQDAEPSRLLRLRRRMSCLLGWWLVPVTMLCLWGRALVRNDVLMTSVHIFCFTISCWGSAWVCRAAATTRSRRLGGR